MTEIVQYMNLFLTLHFLMRRNNPLHDHPNYTEEMKKYFETVGLSEYDPIVWEKLPGFILFYNYSNDYRVTRVYNIKFLISTKKGDQNDFFISISKCLITARKSAIKACNSVKFVGDALLRIFKNEVHQNLQRTREIRNIANFLGTTENIAIESFICAFGMTWISRTAHAISLFVCFSKILASLNPGAALSIKVLLDLLCIFSTKSKLNYEIAINCATILNTFFNCINFYQEDVKNSNVFITAIDERNFWSIFRYTSLRPNHGAWCGFSYIKGLKNAPKARDIDGGKIIDMYIDIFNRINSDDELNLESLENYISGYDFIQRQLSYDQNNEETRKHKLIK